MTSVPAPGTVLSDRYRLADEIGSGGAGRVFRAHDDRLERDVAVKVLTDLGETAVSRFRREAATAARIRHGNVVTLHDAGVDGSPYLVMSLVDGPSLADRVEQEGPLPVDQLGRLARDLFAGLDATHAAGVLHRDLTPRNVLFDHDGTALLADFGIARGPDDPTITAPHTVMGTRPFVAPERLRSGADATPATDVYAVGVTLRYAATGSHGGPMPDDHPFAGLVAACTAEDPDARPADARAAGRHLERLTSADGAVPPTSVIAPVEATTVMHRERASVPRGGGISDTPPRPMPITGVRGQADPPARRPVTGGPERGDQPAQRRPVAALGLLAALAIAAVIGSIAVRNGTDPVDTEAEAGAQTEPADGASGETSGGEPAPAFDPAAPDTSARELADWLRSQD